MWGMGEGGGGRLNVNFQTCAVKNLHLWQWGAKQRVSHVALQELRPLWSGRLQKLFITFDVKLKDRNILFFSFQSVVHVKFCVNHEHNNIPYSLKFLVELIC